MKNLIKNIPIVGNLGRYLKHKFIGVINNRRIKYCISENSPIKIVTGASGVFENGWIPTDQYNLDLLKIKSFEKLFKGKKATVFLAEHVWEHLTIDDGLIAAKNYHQYLNVGGYMRIAVPDGFHSDKNYIKMVDVGGTGAGSDDHKILYTYKTLSLVFEKAGFKVKLLEYFDENGKFNSINWDKEGGMIHRSTRYDERNKNNPITYTSTIIDAFKL